jgi:quercetin dioxygenase-like cupin family protein
MEIEVLGVGCPKCTKMYEAALKAVALSGKEARVRAVTDLEEIARRGVFLFPAIVVDGVLRSAGRLLEPEAIVRLLEPGESVRVGVPAASQECCRRIDPRRSAASPCREPATQQASRLDMRREGVAMTDTAGAARIAGASPSRIAEMVQYQEGSVVSHIIFQHATGSLTVFAFDQGQALSEHTVPGDAFVQVLEGKATITIGGTVCVVSKDEMVLMPGGVPHQVSAEEQFKMLLTLFRGARS